MVSLSPNWRTLAVDTDLPIGIAVLFHEAYADDKFTLSYVADSGTWIEIVGSIVLKEIKDDPVSL